MSDINKISVMSSFLKGKIDENGWSMKKFIEETGLSQGYAYKLVSDNRDFTPNDETLNKIAEVMAFSEKDRKYLLDLAAKERETGSLIYEDVPAPLPVPTEPGPAPQPPEPVPHPDPQPPSPHPPVPVPSPGPVEVSWTHKKVILGVVVGLIAGLLLGCCISSVFIPLVCQYLNVQDYPYFHGF